MLETACVLFAFLGVVVRQIAQRKIPSDLLEDTVVGAILGLLVPFGLGELLGVQAPHLYLVAFLIGLGWRGLIKIPAALRRRRRAWSFACQCGRPVAASDRFCDQCGAWLG